MDASGILPKPNFAFCFTDNLLILHKTISYTMKQQFLKLLHIYKRCKGINSLWGFAKVILMYNLIAPPTPSATTLPLQKYPSRNRQLNLYV
jgi:hypothetical protein